MNNFRQTFCAITLTAIGAATASAGAPPALTTEVVASGLNRPVYVTHAPGDFERLFFLEKRGVMRVIDLDTNTVSDVMNIDARVGGGTSDFSEQGLLGLAFHPDFASNGFFYLNYTDTSGDTNVSRFTMVGDPMTSNTADPSSEDLIIEIAQDFSNHNAGWIDFNPLEVAEGDNYLYVSLGDGGSGNDPFNRAQTRTNLLGSMLRIDVGDGTSGSYTIPPDNPYAGHPTFCEEIWSYGLRNPFRNSFDRETGDFYIGDVGQSAREEVNFEPFSNTGGRNYGWRCREGTIANPSVSCTPVEPATDPVHDYAHNPPEPPASFICSVIGGYVYRGCAIPGLEGTYFFADNCGNTVWSFEINGAGTGIVNFTDWTSSLGQSDVVSFGEDALGEMYIVSQNGTSTGVIRRIVAADGPLNDCNANGVEDACDIAAGDAEDGNANGIPDSCEGCEGDADASGTVDVNDVSFVIFRLGDTGNCTDGDVDGSGIVNVNDISFVIFRLGTCDPPTACP